MVVVSPAHQNRNLIIVVTEVTFSLGIDQRKATSWRLLFLRFVDRVDANAPIFENGRS